MYGVEYVEVATTRTTYRRLTARYRQRYRSDMRLLSDRTDSTQQLQAITTTSLVQLGFDEEAFVCHSELAFVNQEKVPGISSLFRRPQLSGIISSSRI
jgi:hypothetical protein